MPNPTIDGLTFPRRPAASSRATVFYPLLLVVALTAMACGPSSSEQNFAACGNDRIDAAELCDDGNLDDHDSCTAVCRPARCGDGTTEIGVEQCDGADLNINTCFTLGLQGNDSALACTTACEFDVSRCGPILPTFTPTPAVAPTSTPTPIPCGDGLLQSGQTCEECQADCEPAACEPTTDQVRFRVTLQPPGADPIQKVILFVGYRSSVISIPGTGSDSTVRRRVRPVPPFPSQFTVGDLGYGLDIFAQQTTGLAMNFVTAEFDICSGAPAPTVDDLSCTVDDCEFAGRPASGCTCAIETVEP